ncbi:MAG TPA: c-type cytochrome [Gammaproteobacteria bacterium]|nr:c-type cytochrome [Gammaproteobacteria bacterium]
MISSRSIRSLRRILPGILIVAATAFAIPAFAGPANPPPDHHGMKIRLAACATCHGKRGQGGAGTTAGVYPRLADQPAGYLYKQLLRFKSARRTGIPPVKIMHHLLINLPAPYLQLIAAYYAAESPPFPPAAPRDQARWEEGRKLVQHGVPSEGIEACTSCHGSDLQGQPPSVPALAGQYARYLTIQFEHWAQGARHDPLHEHIAETLTTPQIQAMSHYLASLRPAANSTRKAE